MKGFSIFLFSGFIGMWCQFIEQMKNKFESFRDFWKVWKAFDARFENWNCEAQLLDQLNMKLLWELSCNNEAFENTFNETFKILRTFHYFITFYYSFEASKKNAFIGLIKTFVEALEKIKSCSKFVRALKAQKSSLKAFDYLWFFLKMSFNLTNLTACHKVTESNFSKE